MKGFEKEVLGRQGRVIALFEANWCPFCRAFKPIAERREREVAWPIVAVDIDDWNDPLWERYEIEVVPTFIVFSGAEPVFRIEGILGVGLSDSDLDKLLSYISTGKKGS